ncbi:unnamed protein product, partial [Cylicostephanus goldi]
TPFRVPFLSNSTEAKLDPKSIEQKRHFIQQSRSTVSTVSLSDEVSKKIQDSFVTLCSTLDKKVDKAAYLNEMLIMSRLVASSSGSGVVEFEHWEHAVRMSAANTSAMSAWRSQHV